MKKNDEERFQERVDELLFLEHKVEGHIERLAEMNAHYKKVYEAVTQDLTQKMSGVNESFKKINDASDNIADYMRHCDHHAKYTRNIFIGTLLGSIIVIAATLGWSYDLKTHLAADIKAFKDLEYILKNEPDLKRYQGKDYVRLAEAKLTAIEDEHGEPIPGDYAQVWYKR